MLDAIRKARPRTFLTYDELLSVIAREYLSRKPTLRGEVDRILAAQDAEVREPKA